MKTTIDLDDHLLREAKKRAGEEGRTLKSVVEDALRRSFQEEPPPGPYVFDFPIVNGGTPMVDVADRDALYDFLDGYS